MKDQQNSVAPDEDVFDFPKAWLRYIHPRRGGVPAAVKPAGPAEARSLMRAPAGEGESVDAARRYLAGEPDPVGAAAVAAAAVKAEWKYERKAVTFRTLVDAWVAEHGLAFAAEAVVERCKAVLAADRRFHNGTRMPRGLGEPEQEALWRVRAFLAAADDAGYAAAAERLDAVHWPAEEEMLGAWIVAYLLPDRQDRVDDLLAAGPRWERLDTLVLCSLGRPSQLDGLLPRSRRARVSTGTIATLADGIGTAVLAYLLNAVADGRQGGELRRCVFDAVAVLPTDDAFRALLDRRDDRHGRGALMDAMRRFPHRAVRLLADAGDRDAAELLDGHVRAHADLVAAALPDLPDGARAAVEPILAAMAPRVPEAPAADLPACLTAPPPWKRPVKPAAPGLEPPAPRVAWPAGMREAWLAADTSEMERLVPEPDWADLAAGTDRFLGRMQLGNLLLFGPEDVVRPVLPKLVRFAYAESWMKPVVARYGVDAHDLVVRAAGLYLPFLSAPVAAGAADDLLRGGESAATAVAWLDLHGTDAVPYLAPAALGRPGKPRRAAEHALRRLAARHGADAVAAACPGAADELRTLLTAHPVQTGLVKRPAVGDWVRQAALPQVLLRGGDRALPEAHVPRLLELLALPVPYGLDELRAAFEPASLAELGWSVFAHWLDLGRPSKESWALAQLGGSGDDEAVRRLAPLIRAWPGEGGHKYAVTGLDVLAGIGSDVALMHLHSISQKVKFKGLRARAQEKIAEVAEARGLSLDELADRLVPHFGLDADGSMALDYGPRRFTVGFDEQLKPFVVDEAGKVRKALPKPGAKDDPELAPAAHKAFAALKKDVRTVAADQLRRLERAMVEGRRWTPDEFRAHLVRHPLAGHLARRLVWLADTADGTASFRVAEDGTLADADDKTFDLAESARVGIAHPLHLGDTLPVWREVFADYEILQPFEQLARPVHALTDAERESGRLERFEGLEVPFGTVLGLEKRGWERAEPGDGGSQEYMSRRAGADRYTVVDLYPGFSIGVPDATGDVQLLEHVRFAAEPGRYWGARSTPPPLGDLDPVAASEIIADLETLRDAAR
ncbi:DUF4132 domain-containing protein [Actinomadura sp. WAC 06369]|uniref:DUF4132 domain-containing protein n=1 Tax=Actinomadura sp. WAC 06369 TaxID=2203193 RepID=UPI000F79E414|nr:DUF4132 domain-containing protein [Actinomadura sp. WAC 06369]RSN68896.1 DUF4132 domain-containing protein [Actinomadura sp. WAC 06369]